MKTLIFDFDGTIADSFDFVFDFLAHVSSPNTQFGSVERKAFRYKSMVAIARGLGIKWWRLPGLLYKGRAQMRAQLDQIRAFEEIPPLLRELHGQQYRMMILSSNIEPTIKTFLRRHEIDGYFEAISGNVGMFGKGPALRKMITKHHLKLEDCVYIGDEVRDVTSAKSVNMACIAVTWGFADPTKLRELSPFAVVASTQELRTAITKFTRS